MRQLFYITVLLLPLLLSGTNSYADSNEEKFKAAFIYNFSRFSTWPESSLSEHLRICIITENSLGSALKALETRSAHNRKLVVRNLSMFDNINDCAVVYLPSANVRLQQQLIERARHQEILTISNGVTFVEMGGIIGFEEVLAERKFKQTIRLGFAINLNAAKQAGIKLSSKLLSLAMEIKH